MNERIIACQTCGQAHRLGPVGRGMVARCVRCDAVIERHTVRSLHRTAALSLAAIVLYVPANLFPILRLQSHGHMTQNTIWDGVKRLWIDGDPVIAIIVLLASIVIPLLKLFGLFFLVLTTWLRWPLLRKVRTGTYQLIESVGRWAMLDVFALAILVSIVKLQGWATILPGRGLFAFGCVVVLTLLASASFDSQLIWDEPDRT